MSRLPLWGKHQGPPRDLGPDVEARKPQRLVNSAQVFAPATNKSPRPCVPRCNAAKAANAVFDNLARFARRPKVFCASAHAIRLGRRVNNRSRVQILHREPTRNAKPPGPVLAPTSNGSSRNRRPRICRHLRAASMPNNFPTSTTATRAKSGWQPLWAASASSVPSSQKTGSAKPSPQALPRSNQGHVPARPRAMVYRASFCHRVDQPHGRHRSLSRRQLRRSRRLQATTDQPRSRPCLTLRGQQPHQVAWSRIGCQRVNPSSGFRRAAAGRQIDCPMKIARTISGNAGHTWSCVARQTAIKARHGPILPSGVESKSEQYFQKNRLAPLFCTSRGAARHSVHGICHGEVRHFSAITSTGRPRRCFLRNPHGAKLTRTARAPPDTPQSPSPPR